MAERTKVEVGQVWTWQNSKDSFRITRLDRYYGNAYAEASNGQGYGEEIFCCLDKEGYPIQSEVADSEWVHWTITLPEVAPVAEAAQPPGLTFAQWLTAPRPGNCVCDIPRHQCRFHR